MAEPAQNPPPIPPPGPPPPPEERTLADLVVEVSENASTLVREEIELAKAEISHKVNKILRGSAVGVAAGTFAFLALILILHGIAWLLGEELFSGNIWAGYFVTAGIFLLIAALAGLIAFRALKAGTPPVPEQAIAEAKLTKEMLEKEAS
ncbi:MAG TPA: phage holin family protein [Solirubrobacterales bacterium]|nr:phage holin family protein [Solirubrobacterales bacterium]